MREDDDIKIAGKSEDIPAVDFGEEAARQFLEQKQLGNIDKARELGKLYASSIIHMENGPIEGISKNLTPRQLHQQLVLYSYAVNRVIAEHSPNSIVAQTCLNVFYSEIESLSENVKTHVSDMAAFSLYILCERSPNRSESEIGTIYAELCDLGGNPDIIKEGNDFYSKVYSFCWDKLIATDFVA